MELVVVESSGPLCLVLKGRLDAAGTEQVEVAFAARIRAASGHAMVDMRAVSFVGSLGLRMLVAAARAADRAGRKMVIFGVQAPVAEVFSTTALDELIPVLPDEATARGHIGG